MSGDRFPNIASLFGLIDAAIGLAFSLLALAGLVVVGLFIFGWIYSIFV